jgi:hypothetical protein
MMLGEKTNNQVDIDIDVTHGRNLKGIHHYSRCSRGSSVWGRKEGMQWKQACRMQVGPLEGRHVATQRNERVLRDKDNCEDNALGLISPGQTSAVCID